MWMQSQCRVEIVRTMPPSVFWPQPKVTSAIVQITVDHERRGAIPELSYWHDFVRAMFLHRRKFLRSCMLGAFKRRLSKPEVDELMEQVGFGPTTRAEQLDVATMLRFYEVVREKIPEGCPSAARTPKKRAHVAGGHGNLES
jgi:16S rRNA (adenine1518-N6/adenine1519-N6)-dimethyltransferase